MGFSCAESDDPYEAMMLICRQPLFYSAVIVCLHSLYREELQIISSIKRRFTYIEIWLADTDGRQAALVEAMRLGADGLVDEEGLHRIGGVTISPPPRVEAPVAGKISEPAVVVKPPIETKQIVEETKIPATEAASGLGTDPLLTAEELRALLETHTPRTN
jgi:hypothetical protein